MRTRDIIEKMPTKVMQHIKSIKEQRNTGLITYKSANEKASEYLHGLCDAGLITDRERGKLFVYCTM